jgi:hypothetical protein
MRNDRRNFRNLKVKPHCLSKIGGTNSKLRKLHAPKSNYAARLEAYYSRKFGQVVTLIAIVKTLAVISSTFKMQVKLWVLNVAPSRHLKSQTTLEQTRIFSKSRLVYVGSDFTIHSLQRNYRSGKGIDNKCLLINDLALLLASKAERTKARLIDALSELASEGYYIYSDWQKTYEIKARFSLIANITPQSFLYNRNRLLGNTFTERCLVVHHALTDEEMSEANLSRKERASMKIEPFRPSIQEEDVKITREDEVRFDEYARRWRILGAYSSSSALFDMIKSVVVAYAILAGHRRITRYEYRYLDMLEPYLANPNESVKLRILELTHEGRSIRDICQILNQDYEKYRPFVSRTIHEYRRRGVLPPTTPHVGFER